MSNEVENEAAAPVVNRNGVNATLSLGIAGKKSDKAGMQFWYPEIDSANLINVWLPWIGIDDLAAATTVWLRKEFFDIAVDNTNEETGLVNQAQMEIDWREFTAGRQSLSDLETAIETLNDKQWKLVDSPDFGATTDVVDENGQTVKAKTPKAIALDIAIKELHDKVQPLKIQKATIEAKYAERTAKRKAAKEAKEAAAAAAKANS